MASRPPAPTAPIPPEQLRWTVPPGALDFETTADIDPETGIIGQRRALEALRHGVRLDAPGYNLFATGLSTTGRLGTIARILTELKPRRRVHRDLIYVACLSDAGRPKLVRLPTGKGETFAQELEDLGRQLIDAVPGILHSEPVRKARDAAERERVLHTRRAFEAVEKHAQSLGLLLGQIEGEETPPEPVLVLEEKAWPRTELRLAIEDGTVKVGRPWPELSRAFEAVEDGLAEAMLADRASQLAGQRRVRELERRAVAKATKGLFSELGRRYRAARTWLKALHIWACNHYPQLAGGELQPAFEANVVHRGSRSAKAPVVVAYNPSYANLFGGEVGATGSVTDHRSLRAGALLDADGGFIILNLNDLAEEPGVWRALKRSLMFEHVELQNSQSLFGLPQLRPDPIPIDVRVILVGEPGSYDALWSGDPDFPSLFKIKAEFAPDSPIDESTPDRYAGFLRRMIDKEGLRQLDRGAVAAVVERAVREAGRGGRVSTRFGDVIDLVREADHIAKGPVVTRAEIREAIALRHRRNDAGQERAREAVGKGRTLIETRGSQVGQVNGLAVYTNGPHSHGRALRISARVGTGRGNVISLDRDTKLTGATHDKGINILTGFLRGTFARQRTFPLRATLVFEQSYGRINGDSASSAELYALLSAIAQIPIHQGVAVTGSVDQFGRVQTIGGVNTKIEGFFDTCVATGGLTGDQGVIIPTQNAADLMLREEVVEACAAGRFHVWPVSTIEEGLRHLTGREPGQANAKGVFPRDTIYRAVCDELVRLQDTVRRASKGPAAAKKPDAKKPASKAAADNLPAETPPAST